MVPESALLPSDSALALPRILCLHGGGTNARIFRSQCRKLIEQLKDHVRLVFVDAPFASGAGPDVMSVYGSWGPFRRWLRWLPDHPEIEPDLAVRHIDDALRDAMRRDNDLGATGEWVALLGFSQGAKVCASLLYRQQIQARASRAQPRFRFGVLIAGRAPLVSLEPGVVLSPSLPDASQITDFVTTTTSNGEHVLQIPTLHVHGTQDPGLHLHRRLLEDYCDPNMRRLVVWEGGHRVPLKQYDSSLVVQEIYHLLKDTGVC